MQENGFRPGVRQVRNLSIAAALALIVLSAFSFLGKWHWGFELLSHFRVQFLLASVTGLVLLLALRQWQAGFALGVLALAHGMPILAHIDRAGNSVQLADERTGIAEISLFYLNMHHRSANHRALFSHIRDTRPDVVVLTEVDPRRQAAIFADLAPLYPNRLTTDGTGPFDMAVFSRYPLRPVGSPFLEISGWPLVHAAICPAGHARCAELIAVHAPRPGRRQTARRDRVFAEVAARAATVRRPLFVVGDFNCTPWSPAFQRLLRQGRLRDGGAVHAALAPTWLSRTALFGLDIDHVLTSRGMFEQHRKIGPAFGSDHFSVQVNLLADLGRLAPVAPAS